MLFRKLAGDVRQWSFPFLAKLTLARVGAAPGREQRLHHAVGGLPGHLGPIARASSTTCSWARSSTSSTRRRVPSVSLSGALSVPTADAIGYVRTTDALFIGYVTKDVGPCTPT